MKTKGKIACIILLCLAIVMNIFDIVVDTIVSAEKYDIVDNVRLNITTHILIYGPSIILLMIYFASFHAKGRRKSLFTIGLILTEVFAPLLFFDFYFDSFRALKIEHFRGPLSTVAFAFAISAIPSINRGLKNKTLVVISSVFTILDGLSFSFVNWLVFDDYSTFYEGVGLVMIGISILIFAILNTIHVEPAPAGKTVVIPSRPQYVQPMVNNYNPNVSYQAPQVNRYQQQNEVEVKLAQLKNMFEKGLISESEYQTKRMELVNKYFN